MVVHGRMKVFPLDFLYVRSWATCDHQVVGPANVTISFEQAIRFGSTSWDLKKFSKKKRTAGLLLLLKEHTHTTGPVHGWGSHNTTLGHRTGGDLRFRRIVRGFLRFFKMCSNYDAQRSALFKLTGGNTNANMSERQLT
ncbi:hypothetical protein EVAR_57930_1 [Eumeta japonica]|uniref:Uncharacterized protein n=1 Tax=Eumeta variegata TaxID=151549 RepID=A0A4C1ZNB2_EUMVA|nr:hypothetical protein EVAR_57930_1 [Eumeta japonica]